MPSFSRHPGILPLTVGSESNCAQSLSWRQHLTGRVPSSSSFLYLIIVPIFHPSSSLPIRQRPRRSSSIPLFIHPLVVNPKRFKPHNVQSRKWFVRSIWIYSLILGFKIYPKQDSWFKKLTIYLKPGPETIWTSASVWSIYPFDGTTILTLCW